MMSKPKKRRFEPNQPVWVEYDGVPFAGIARVYGNGNEHDCDDVLVFFPESDESAWIFEDQECIWPREDDQTSDTKKGKKPKRPEKVLTQKTSITCT